MIHPDYNTYLHLFRPDGLVPLWMDLVADLDTPVSLYRKLCPGSSHSFLLESVTGGDQVARYSFIGLEPMAVITSRGGVIQTNQNGRRQCAQGQPLAYLSELLTSYHVEPLPGLPRFFGGAVGYYGYDLSRCLEKLPQLAPDDLNLPECYAIIPRLLLAYDHAQRRLKIIALIQAGKDPSRTYREGEDLIHRTVDLLHRPITADSPVLPLGKGPELGNNYAVCNTDQERFIQNVHRALQYIRSGDIFQVVLSQRWQRPYSGDPFMVYRTLRAINPSPYMFYLNFPEVQLVGASPEMLVRVEGGEVRYRPIAGTRPRGATDEEDLRLARELAADPKEQAEHVMLVDLGRNDLGKVCAYGSVEVPRFMQVEHYSHVMHLVSDVTGKLAPGRNALDALMACFPAGTVTGAPKVRAMEIIEELEPTRRGPYAGAVGYLGFNGNMDTCITIRTMVFRNNQAFVQAGAGIVADSHPELEHLETWNKARALLVALALAEEVQR